ncbi:AraC family transcriptional regulator [Bacillus shivajii]|uniref:AraC family transcriptional regulator n=1 Tax=Bacillus shivajii TaxID=1983719 RepID=UPI001CFC2335|nr:AraC family transcriptional regulator [Bacillus shivajii]UCZ52019.1 AraC family transcriptional regulator [Bacillus shivajii]
MNMLTSIVPPMPTFIKGGEATFIKGMKHFKRTFHLFDLLYVTKGTLYMKENDSSYEIRCGQFIILAPGFEHVGEHPCSEDTDFFWIHFSFTNQFNLIGKKEVDWSEVFLKESTYTSPSIFNLHLPRYGEIRQSGSCNETLERLITINESGDPAMKLKQQMIFSEFILLLQEEAMHIPSTSQTVVDQVLYYIKNNYDNKEFTVKGMAKSLLYHPDYITRSMKKVTGVTPIQYLHYYRLTVAKQKLVNENLDLKTISSEAGFKDVSYFSRIFKQKEGITPGEYRRIRRNQL